jgi:hypothetical protein
MLHALFDILRIVWFFRLGHMVTVAPLCYLWRAIKSVQGQSTFNTPMIWMF